jgi:7-cyano-7-deazaguanine reductase
MIETFPNPRPGREFEIAIDCPEFTSMCPKTGLPDFGTIHIRTCPTTCIELKALKYYLLDYPEQGHLLRERDEPDPRRSRCRVRAQAHDRRREFTPRGGIKTTVTATYNQPG